jgi:hypothetical protein
MSQIRKYIDAEPGYLIQISRYNKDAEIQDGLVSETVARTTELGPRLSINVLC